MELDRKISHILSDQIPEYISAYYPLYVIFMSKYFEYLDNSSSGVQWSIQNIELNRDIDTTASSLAVQFLNTYAPNLPNETAADSSIVVKYFKECFKNKGNEKSFRFFFKAFFNDDISIGYPREQLFSTSAGNWYIEKRLRVRNNVGNAESLKHTWVTGLTSTASAVVNDVVRVVGQNGELVYDLILEPHIVPRGTFTSGEAIRGIVYDFADDSTSVVTVSSIASLTTADGVYRDINSQLSQNQVLQDSLYYQHFSYVIKSGQDRDTWADHILKQLHPTGTIMFNEFAARTVPSNNPVTSVVVRTTIDVPRQVNFLSSPTYTFDRTADLQTGTSNTLVDSPSGFIYTTYTTMGSIAYNADYDYPGEHVTFALQTTTDTYTGSDRREVSRLNGASWDKYENVINYDSQLIPWNYDTNTSLVRTRFAATSSITAAGTTLVNFTSGVISYGTPAGSLTDTSVGSMVMLITYGKNSRGNLSGEENNTLYIRVSSSATFVPYFDTQTQRNYQDIALGGSLGLNDLNFITSSNTVQYTIQTPGSIQANSSTGLLVGAATTFLSTFKEGDTICLDNFDTSYTITNLYSNTSMLISPNPVSSYTSSIVYHTRNSGQPVSSASYIANSVAHFRFKPYNGQRGASYDRLAMRIELAQEKQFSTSLSETFNTANITSTGAIASYSSTGVNASSFTSNTSTVFVFESNAFALNGGGSITYPYVQTTSFVECGQLDIEIDYLVGDVSNGGNIPQLDENLRLQYSTNGGASWFVASDIWLGGSSNIWTYATTSQSGQIFTSVNNTTINGIGTAFLSDFDIGDRLYFLNSYNTTAYTITAIANNNQMSVYPPTTQALRSSTAIIGRAWHADNTASSYSRVFGIGTDFTSLNRDEIISFGSSTTTAYTIVNIVSNTAIDVTPPLIDSLVTSTLLSGVLYFASGTTTITGSGTIFNTELSTGALIRLESANSNNTSYTVLNINSNTSITVTPTLAYTTSAVMGYTVSSTGASVSSYVQTAGVPYFLVLPAADQFQTTSLTVYGPGPETSITVRIIKSTIGPTTDNVYAINNARFNSFRYQDTTGTVNIHVSVSSGADLYIADSDYLDITTIGTI